MMIVHTYKSEKVWEEAGKFLTENIVPDRKTLILLSGGSATKLYKDLGDCLKSHNTNIALAQVDERFQPEDLGSVNAHDISRTGLWKICEENKIPCHLISQKGTLEEASQEYERVINHLLENYTYKIAILGIGPDGHTAGLLPGYERVWNKEKSVAGYENRGLYPKRISITPQTLLKLDQGLIVAVGEGKKDPIAHALSPKSLKNLDACPALMLQKLKHADLFTDVKVP